MTKNEDILKQFEVIERQTLEVENVVEKNYYFTIFFFQSALHPIGHLSKISPMYAFKHYTILLIIYKSLLWKWNQFNQIIYIFFGWF